MEVVFEPAILANVGRQVGGDQHVGIDVVVVRKDYVSSHKSLVFLAILVSFSDAVIVDTSPHVCHEPPFNPTVSLNEHICRN
jgi:hypothetical protein